jgi:hypothetical protein
MDVTSLNRSLPPLVWTCQKKKIQTNNINNKNLSYINVFFIIKLKKKKWQMLLAAGEQDASS